MQVGDLVRVKESVIFYHHPLHRNEAFDAQGMEGQVTKLVKEWKGTPISANFPVLVKFEVEGAKRPFQAHLRDDELETIS